MKKTKMFIAVAAIGMMSLASCKKDWTCECTTTAMGMSSSATVTINDTKSNAKEECEAGSSNSTVMGIETKVDCRIKD